MSKQCFFLCIVVLATAFQISMMRVVGRAQGQENSGSVRTSSILSEGRAPKTRNTVPPGHIRCRTTKGDFEVTLRPDLAPSAVNRLQEMVEIGFFNQGIAFFRVNQWLTQFGADQHGRADDPFASIRRPLTKEVHPDLKRNNAKLSSWERGTLALIGGTQMVIVIHPNPNMGTNSHDAPAGFVTKGMDTVFDSLHQYNDPINNPKGAPGPLQTGIFKEGLAYIEREFPQTDIIKSCQLF